MSGVVVWVLVGSAGIGFGYGLVREVIRDRRERAAILRERMRAAAERDAAARRLEGWGRRP